MRPRRPSQLDRWPEPFAPGVELDWSDPLMSRRLLREHLDQEHDGASRREVDIERHVARLRRLLPPPPAAILDAAAGPGLYAVRLAALGYDVTALDAGPAVVRHARRLAATRGLAGSMQTVTADLRTWSTEQRYDAVLLIYHVLEGFSRRQQVAVLRRLASLLRDRRSRLVVEARLRPDQPGGRITSWEVVDRSLLSDRRHLLLVDTTYDERSATFILRETAVFDDGSTSCQQTTSQLLRHASIPTVFARAGLRVQRTYDGWSRFGASELSDSALIVSRLAPPAHRHRRRLPDGRAAR
ncbi:MAG: class I SAM-dependent methyltransferase [Candidatus Dormibacteria bacterium]